MEWDIVGGVYNYDSFNQNMEHLGSVGPTPLFMMPALSPVSFSPSPEN